MENVSFAHESKSLHPLIPPLPTPLTPSNAQSPHHATTPATDLNIRGFMFPLCFHPWGNLRIRLQGTHLGSVNSKSGTANINSRNKINNFTLTKNNPNPLFQITQTIFLVSCFISRMKCEVRVLLTKTLT